MDIKEITDIVLGCHQEILNENGINRVSKVGMNMSRGNGIDSLGIVSLILKIEDTLEIELDNYFIQIRKAYTMTEFIDVIYEAVKE